MPHLHSIAAPKLGSFLYMQQAVTAGDKECTHFKEAKLHKYKSDVKYV